MLKKDYFILGLFIIIGGMIGAIVWLNTNDIHYTKYEQLEEQKRSSITREEYNKKMGEFNKEIKFKERFLFYIIISSFSTTVYGFIVGILNLYNGNEKWRFSNIIRVICALPITFSFITVIVQMVIYYFIGSIILGLFNVIGLDFNNNTVSIVDGAIMGSISGFFIYFLSKDIFQHRDMIFS
jgi:ABC-type sugar transport system permease subunit